MKDVSKIKNVARNSLATLCCVSLLSACGGEAVDEPSEETSSPSVEKDVDVHEWVSIFDGESLDGWTVKIAGQALGVDPLNTFRVEEGSLVGSYENYDAFENRFGHIFYKEPFSHYRIRLDYRFTGEALADTPEWAILNSGVMLHAQDPATMPVDIGFPASVEAQLLGSSEEWPERTTANICTPGTHVHIGDELITDHCIQSETVGARLDEWANFEAEVSGSKLISLKINGEPAFELTDPVWDRTDDWGSSVPGNDVEVSSGFIGLQAEGHSVEFRNVEIMNLAEKK